MGQGFISKYILRGIADFIRGRKNTTAEIKPVDMVAELESIPTYEQGKQAEYDRFWDIVQNYGKRTNYIYAFCGYGWTEETFKPKYDIRPRAASGGMFRYSTMTNLVDILAKAKVVIDFSAASNIEQLFTGSDVTHFGVIDGSNCSNMNYVLYSAAKLISVIKLILKDDGSQTFIAFAEKCASLVDIIFEGVIGQNGLNLQWSTKLSHDSIVSIINCLSTTTSGLSITLSKTAVENAFTDEEWTELEQTRPNWTIVLV